MITVLSFCACVLAMVGSYCNAKGWQKIVYCNGIVCGLAFTAVNVMLAFGVGQQGVLWLVIPSGWGILCSIAGLRRLRRIEAKK